MHRQSDFPPIPLSRNELPWYNRLNLEGYTTQFSSSAKDSFTVYLTSDAVIDLHTGTYQQIPCEAFGLLMGRVYKDDEGSFTVIERVFYARNLNTGTGHVQLSPEEIYDFRLLATRKHPAMDFVGWTHSHEKVSKYSDIDYQEQETWDDPNHVGILTFMDGVKGSGKTWAIMYRGPSSQPLKFLRDATPSLRQSNKLPPFSREIQKTQEQTPFLASQQPQEPATPLIVGSLTKTDTELLKLPSQKLTTELDSQSARNLWKRLSWQSCGKAILFITLLLIIVIVGVILGDLLMARWFPMIPASLSTTVLLKDMLFM